MRSAALLPLLCVGACVTGNYNQVSINEPVDLELLRALQPGKDDLTTCLQKLGAPVDVQEYQVGMDLSSGVALIWYWSQQYGWGLDISAPVGDDASLSFEMDFGGNHLPGCVLWFDRDLVLERWREGLVGELLQGRRRPAPVLDGD
ncbi:MAG: hypothetical protein ACE37K_07190 [Planctomycetota bacterium]